MIPENKKKALLISFSDSETSFLGRVAKILSFSGQWDVSFLILHPLAKTSPILDNLLASGISHTVMLEIEFYDHYAEDIVSAVEGYRGNPKKKLSLIERLAFTFRKLEREEIPALSYRRGILAVLSVMAFFHHMVRKIKRLLILFKGWLARRHPQFYLWLRAKYSVLRHKLNEISFVSRRIFRIQSRNEIHRLEKCISAAEGFFQFNKPDILILAKDSAYYTTSTFVRAAKSQSIPSAIMPYDRADSETLAKDRRGHPSHVIKGVVAKEIAEKYPKWVYMYKNQPLLLTNPPTIHAMEALGLSPQNPWLYNGSRCDKVFLETEEDKVLFIRGGAPEDQLTVIGAPYMDKIDELKLEQDQRRVRLCQEYGFDAAKPFVVASVSPNKIRERDTDLEFKSYDELIDNWATALTDNLDCNLIYSLHPLTKHSDIQFIEERGGKVLKIPLEELLALADLYVVDCSGTARWARYANVDVIDYDFYKYDLWFNSKIEGVIHVETYEDFVAELRKADKKLQYIQHRSSPRSQPDEGKYRDRLLLNLEKLVEKGEVGGVI